MDCASCAAKIEKAAISAGVLNAKISTASQILTLDIDQDDARLDDVERAVLDAGYHLDRIPPGSAAQSNLSQPHLAAGYRRALLVVVALNIGYGIIEMVGGFVLGSQALKADALDFLGDGLITLLGVLAIGWSLLWRARSALVQGLFLGVLGLGVIVNTIWRVYSQQPVEAALMGVVALVAPLQSMSRRRWFWFPTAPEMQMCDPSGYSRAMTPLATQLWSSLRLWSL